MCYSLILSEVIGIYYRYFRFVIIGQKEVGSKSSLKEDETQFPQTRIPSKHKRNYFTANTNNSSQTKIAGQSSKDWIYYIFVY